MLALAWLPERRAPVRIEATPRVVIELVSPAEPNDAVVSTGPEEATPQERPSRTVHADEPAPRSNRSKVLGQGKKPNRDANSSADDPGPSSSDLEGSVDLDRTTEGISLGMRHEGEESGGVVPPPRVPRALLESALERPARVDDDVIRTPEDAGFERTSHGRWSYRNPNPRAEWTAVLGPDGLVRFSDPPLAPCRRKQCWIRQKQRLLEKTRELRTRMASAYARRNIEDGLTRLNRQLLEIWNSDRPPHTRRALIFALWDECEEDLGEAESPDTTSATDAYRNRAGQRARDRIIAFVQTKLPEHSPHRFTPEELHAMNAGRRSHQRFEPYGH